MNEVRRNYKDTVFRLLFAKKDKLLSLYNAVNGTDYTEAEALEVNTLENAIYMNMKNDISFVFDFSLNLYEHQSTVNPNMPLRNLFYVSKVLQKMVKDRNLYSSTIVTIPTPRFVVFYNGTEEYPERKVEYLSSAYEKEIENKELELAVTVINLNRGNEELLEACKLLKEYVLYVECVRKYVSEMDVEAAVNQAVDECIREGILAEFLSENRAEVVEVSIFEYDEEKHMNFVRAEGYEEGIARGKADSVIELLEELGEIPEKLREQIMNQKEERLLSKWIKLAGRASSIEEFVRSCREGLD